MLALSTCPDRQSLSDYALGKLSDFDSEAVADHLRDCETCLSSLDALEDHSDSIVEGLRHPPLDDAYSQERGCDLAAARCRALLPALGAAQTGAALGSLRDYR